MTPATPRPTPVEDRLRAHFAERAVTEPLPGPDTEAALAATRRRVDDDGHRPAAPTSSPIRWLFAAAAVLAVAATATAVAVRQGDKVSMAPGSDDDPTTTSSTTPTTSTSTTADQGTATGPSDTPTLVVGPWEPLGGWDGTRWVDGSAWHDGLGFDGTEEAKIVRLDQPITTAATELGGNCDPSPTGDVPQVPGPDDVPDDPGIAVVGVADPRPRPVDALDPSGATYRDDAREVLAGLGVDDPTPVVRQVVRADLDGDGTDEVLVVVDHIADEKAPYPDPGDYSVVYLRRVVDGKVGITVVTSIVHPSLQSQPIKLAPRTRVDAVADLNGDGRMEVALYSVHFESNVHEVYELTPDGKLTERFRGGCSL